MRIGVSFEKKMPKKYNTFQRLKVDAVKTWTKSKYFHTEFIIGNYWVSANTNGIARYNLRPLTERYDYIFIDCNITEEQYCKIIRFIDRQIGKQYDWLGIYLSQFIPIGSNSKNKWFCSEIVTKLLQLCLVEETFELQPHLVSPALIFKILNTMVSEGKAIFLEGKDAERLLREKVSDAPFIKIDEIVK